MEIFKKNVFIATKYKFICNAIIPESEIIQENAVFIKVGINDYRELKDIWSADNNMLPKFMILRSDMPRYSTTKKQGQIYISDIRPKFPDLKDSKEKVNIVGLMLDTYNQSL